ncbi:SDR family NAD(P)-dependent oxidoreductase [Nocardia sp. 2YAB30]|uniref:SDR family NAD(P)-dependent oxidoreductase n=1 Tax=Nocardia sp. 2YAB30 TaxID=3233022 RepID=UPI003F9C3FE8
MNPTYDLTGAVAFVTGAASGMGLVTAFAEAGAGAAVTLTDVYDDALDAAAGALRESGHRVSTVHRDVSDEDQVAAVLWLCSPGASYVVGVALPVDGGYTAR